MGRRRGRGQRTFNPLEKEKKTDDLSKQLIDHFEDIFKRTQAIVHAKALELMAHRLEKREPMAEVIVGSISDAYTMTAFDLRRELAGHLATQERIEDRRIARQAEEAAVQALSEDAAERAFPGVEDDDG